MKTLYTEIIKILKKAKNSRASQKAKESLILFSVQMTDFLNQKLSINMIMPFFLDEEQMFAENYFGMPNDFPDRQIITTGYLEQVLSISGIVESKEISKEFESLISDLHDTLYSNLDYQKEVKQLLEILDLIKFACSD